MNKFEINGIKIIFSERLVFWGMSSPDCDENTRDVFYGRNDCCTN
jgi:hypothetical protein